MPALKIAVNTRLLLKDKMEGVGYYAYETLRRIVAAHPQVEFHFLFDRPYHADFIFADNVKPVVLFPPARHPFLWYWWFEWSVAAYLRRHSFDLFLSPDGYCSLNAPTPTIAIQHDIAFEHFPQYVPKLVAWYYRYFVPRFMRHATRIATVSEYSKKDIVQLYNIDPAKIDVVYNAAKDSFKPVSPEIKKHIRDKYTGGKPYLIYVGSIHPRKNLKNMLLGFEQYRQQHPASDLQFIVAGAAFSWDNNEVKSVLTNMQYSKEVTFTGRLSEAELPLLTGAAFAMLYVSLFEGFGVPPVEAMACGVPVITSDNSSLPEVCGDAALLVNATDVKAIADAISQLWNDTSLAASLSIKGIEQAKKYSWNKSAILLWQSCEKAISVSSK